MRLASKASGVAFLAAAGILIAAVCSGAAAGATLPAPNGAPRSKGAQQLLDYLQNIVRGRHILAGQHDYLEAPDAMVNEIYRVTGRYPALHGYELGAISGQSEDGVRAARRAVVESAKRWSAAGGIVAFTYHARYPGGCYCWDQVQRQTTDAELAAILTAGSPKNGQFVRDLDEMAESLADLQNSGVPVLFRPFHEMNGSWFWWGGKRIFADLWRLTYDRLLRHRGIRNLVWVWSPNAPNGDTQPYADFYPGDAFTDVVALDIYEGAFSQQTYDELVRFAGNKPIAIGENAELPTREALERQPAWLWQMSWGKLAFEKNTPEALLAFYANPHTITRPPLRSNR